MTQLAPYTWIKIGGPAEHLVTVTSLPSLIQQVTEAQKNHLPYRVLGSGSNVLISDSGLLGLTIINRAQSIQALPTHLLVSSGTLMNQLVQYTLVHSLAGLTHFLGLPGTVGGAIFNNSHYQEHLFSDVVISVTSLSESGQRINRIKADCAFGYDTSIFQSNHEVILEAELHLAPGDAPTLQAEAQAALKDRQETQPLDLPSSGCIFKNPPPPSPSAGYLIDHLGLKGTRVGGAEVSKVHANFIVNAGSATARDVITLINQIQTRVTAAYGLELEREIFLLEGPKE